MTPIQLIPEIIERETISPIYLVENSSASALKTMLSGIGEKRFQIFNIDLKSVKTVEQFFNLCSREFKLPEYFGNNWDALEECLRELDWFSCNSFITLLENIDDFKECCEKDFEMLIEVLNEVKSFWEEESRIFNVFLTASKETLATLYAKYEFAKVAKL